ncbi:MAG: M15 family metallopeptidase [Desulfuromonadales bacterium]
MESRKIIIGCSVLILLYLNGCSVMQAPVTDHGVSGSRSAGYLENEIRSRTVGLKEHIAEYRSPEGFFGMALAVPTAIEEQMRLKKSWKEGCPVPLSDLSYLVLTHWGFDYQPRIGELVVHHELATPVLKALAVLFANRYPIEKMELIDTYDADDNRSMEANNTSAFNCRDVTGKPGVFSKHSYGGAIDINPVRNPYITPRNGPLKALGWDGSEDKGAFLLRTGYDVKSPVFTFCSERPADCLVLPPGAAAYVDRTINVPGYLLPDSVAVKAFTDNGFDWGGTWLRLLDYQHFEYDSTRLLKK